MKLIWKISKIIFSILLLIISLDVTILAFPYSFFSQEIKFGNITFYSDEPFSKSLRDEIETVVNQIKAIDIYDSLHQSDVFICQSEKLYSGIATLALVPDYVPGFNLSLLENSFVSIPRLTKIKTQNIYKPKYSVFTGDISHAITHELIHDFQEAQTGFVNYMQIPSWKREGYAEYFASQLESDADTIDNLQSRINYIQQSPCQKSHNIEYFLQRVIVEYLFTNNQMSFNQLISDSITFEDYSNLLLSSK